MPEIQLSTIINLPGNPIEREQSAICQRGTWRILAHPRSIDHNTSTWEATHGLIVYFRIGILNVLEINVGFLAFNHRL
jgi:hypothetical protein